MSSTDEEKETSKPHDETMHNSSESIQHERETLHVDPPADRTLPGLLTSKMAKTLGDSEQQYGNTSPTSTYSHTLSSIDDLEKGVVVQQQHDACDFTERLESVVPPHQTETLVFPTSKLPEIPFTLMKRLRHDLFSVYKRLFSLVVGGNLIAFAIIIVASQRNGKLLGPSIESAATATAVNVLAAILMRQEFFINILYTIFCLTPLWVPLRIRRINAKLYEFGGVHSGCAVSATAWFMLHVALLTKQYAAGQFHSIPALVISYSLLFLLLLICVFAVPGFRFSSHNTFEVVHRFGGWAAVGLFWVEILLVLKAQNEQSGTNDLGLLVVKAPSFWLLLIITFLIVLPWLRLRKVAAVPEILSNHAVRIHFNYRKVGPVLGIRITHNPLTEWHSFATIPDLDTPDGSSFSLIISDAGDWTKRQINQPSNFYWIRGIPVSGVLRMAAVFRRVVIVTTGSGIGPCLSLLIGHPIPCRILWSTPNPSQTYGDKIVGAVRKADPEAMIINTRASGRPDLIALAHQLFVESKAEAVFCISNRKVTKNVVYSLESRGVPAYGPVWDS